MSTYSLMLAATAGTLWVLLIVQAHPMSIATSAFVVAFAAQTQFGLQNDLLSRVPILLLFGLALLFAVGERRSGQPRPTNAASLQVIAVAMMFLLGASLYSSVDIAGTVQALIAAAGVFFVGITLGRFVPVEALFDRLAFATALVCMVSVASIALSSDAYLGNRLSGVFRNPNAMGAAVLIGLVSVPQRWLLWATPPLATLLVLTGSRASGLGFLLVLVLRVRWRPTTRLGAIVVFPLLASLFLLLGAGAFTEEVDLETGPETVTVDAEGGDGDELEILRTRDNRTSQWRQGWVDFRDNLPLGRGFGNAGFEYSNSMLFLLVETGALAVPIALLAAVLVVRASRHADTRVRALAGGLAVHAMFEGWMFAFGSFQAVIFWMLLTAALAQRLSNPEPATANPSVSVDATSVRVPA